MSLALSCEDKAALDSERSSPTCFTPTSSKASVKMSMDNYISCIGCGCSLTLSEAARPDGLCRGCRDERTSWPAESPREQDVKDPKWADYLRSYDSGYSHVNSDADNQSFSGKNKVGSQMSMSDLFEQTTHHQLSSQPVSPSSSKLLQSEFVNPFDPQLPIGPRVLSESYHFLEPPTVKLDHDKKSEMASIPAKPTQSKPMTIGDTDFSKCFDALTALKTYITAQSELVAVSPGGTFTPRVGSTELKTLNTDLKTCWDTIKNVMGKFKVHDHVIESLKSEVEREKEKSVAQTAAHNADCNTLYINIDDCKVTIEDLKSQVKSLESEKAGFDVFSHSQQRLLQELQKLTRERERTIKDLKNQVEAQKATKDDATGTSLQDKITNLQEEGFTQSLSVSYLTEALGSRDSIIETLNKQIKEQMLNVTRLQNEAIDALSTRNELENRIEALAKPTKLTTVKVVGPKPFTQSIRFRVPHSKLPKRESQSVSDEIITAKLLDGPPLDLKELHDLQAKMFGPKTVSQTLQLENPEPNAPTSITTTDNFQAHSSIIAEHALLTTDDQGNARICCSIDKCITVHIDYMSSPVKISVTRDSSYPWIRDKDLRPNCFNDYFVTFGPEFRVQRLRPERSDMETEWALKGMVQKGQKVMLRVLQDEVLVLQHEQEDVGQSVWTLPSSVIEEAESETE